MHSEQLKIFGRIPIGTRHTLSAEEVTILEEDSVLRQDPAVREITFNKNEDGTATFNELFGVIYFHAAAKIEEALANHWPTEDASNQ